MPPTNAALSVPRPLAVPRPACLLPGLALAATQVAVAWLASLFTGDPRGYDALHHWDSKWYQRIVAEGYHGPETPTTIDQSTVAFFPGYPLAALVVRSLTGLPTKPALLLTAQLACWGFWTYLLLLCRDGRLSPRVTAWVVAAAALQPASFFLVAAYSESLFLMAALGYFYWSSRSGSTAAALAVGHGFVMSATRLVGVPLILFPVVRAVLTPPREGENAGSVVRRTAVALLVAGGASLGVLSFFLFC